MKWGRHFELELKIALAWLSHPPDQTMIFSTHETTALILVYILDITGEDIDVRATENVRSKDHLSIL